MKRTLLFTLALLAGSAQAQTQQEFADGYCWVSSTIAEHAATMRDRGVSSRNTLRAILEVVGNNPENDTQHIVSAAYTQWNHLSPAEIRDAYYVLCMDVVMEGGQ